jgi:hypothetical protein
VSAAIFALGETRCYRDHRSRLQACATNIIAGIGDAGSAIRGTSYDLKSGAGLPHSKSWRAHMRALTKFAEVFWSALPLAALSLSLLIFK